MPAPRYRSCAALCPAFLIRPARARHANASARLPGAAPRNLPAGIGFVNRQTAPCYDLPRNEGKPSALRRSRSRISESRRVRRAPSSAISTSPLVRRLVGGSCAPIWAHGAGAARHGLVAAATAANAWLMQPVLDRIFVGHDEQLLWSSRSAVVALALVKGFASYCQSVLMTDRSASASSPISRLGLFARLMRADLAFFHANPTGSLISRFTNDANMLRGAATNVLAGIGKEAVTAVFLVALMFYQDWVLALVSFVVFPLAFRPMVSHRPAHAARLGQYPGRARPVHDLARPDLPGRPPRQGLWHGGLRDEARRAPDRAHLQPGRARERGCARSPRR